MKSAFLVQIDNHDPFIVAPKTLKDSRDIWEWLRVFIDRPSSLRVHLVIETFDDLKEYLKKEE